MSTAIGLYNIAGQLESNSNQIVADLHAQPPTQTYATHFPLNDNVNINMTSMNTDSPGQIPLDLYAQPYAQMPLNLYAQPYAQNFRLHATSLPLHSNVHMNTVDYGNIGRHMTLYPSVSYYGPGPAVGASMNEQLNIPSRNQGEPHRNSSCPLCGSSNGSFGTIQSLSIVHTFTQMRTQANAFNESEYAIIREVRIQLVLGKVPSNTSFSQVLALTQQ